MNGMLALVLALPPFLVALGLAFVLLQRKSKEKKACEKLLAQIKACEAEQRAELDKFLATAINLTDQALADKRDELWKLRKQFMRKILLGFLHRDVELVAAFDKELSQLTRAYHSLKPAVTNEVVSPPVVHQSLSQGDSLQLENDRLRQEIHITLSTLNNIFAEYNSMFGNDDDNRSLTVAQILERMQQMSGEQPDSGADEMLSSDADVLAEITLPESLSEAVMENVTERHELADPVADFASSTESDAEISWEAAFAEAAHKPENS